MRPVKFTSKDLLELFYCEKVLTKEQLLQRSGCSTMTAWRILSTHGYISSYNFNAKYYTLGDIPFYNELGLWSYRKVRFSKYGSLTNTIKALVYNSPSGLETNELQELLCVNIKPLLTKLYRQGKLHRKKINSIFVYFQTDDEGLQKQISKRQSDVLEKTSIKLPEPDRIIAVLVELIQRVELQPQQLVRRLSRKGIKINTDEIQTIFLHYQLKKKLD